MGTSYTPPTNPDWWREPIERTEIWWIVLSFVWCVFMFVWMVGWHFFGPQNMNNETYRITPEAFSQKVADMQAKYTVRKEKFVDSQGTETEEDIVAPPPGSDVYLAAMSWQYRPILELQKGQKYRIHISSLDIGHGFSLQPENINFQVYPGYEQVSTMTPNKTGTFALVCGEYCGGVDAMGHHTMLGRIYVKE